MNTRVAGITFYCAIGLLIGAHFAGFRGNVSDSAPSGLWYENLSQPAELTRGMTIYVCPPARPIVKKMVEMGILWPGNCPDTDSIPLLKSIAALPGDTVLIHHGMPAVVNDIQIPNTTARRNLPAWPDGKYTVQIGEIWIFSSHSDKSFDSRYFGPVKQESVRGEAFPLLVQGGTDA